MKGAGYIKVGNSIIMGETDKIEDRIVKEEISNAISALQKLEKAVMYISRQLVEKSNNIDDLQALSNIADGDYFNYSGDDISSETFRW